MNKIVFIIGLPASGKTTLAGKLFSDYILIDDPKHLQDILKEEYKNKNIVLVDPNLCIQKNLMNAKTKLKDYYQNVEFSEIYFENNPEQCLINAKNRNSCNVQTDIKILTRFYNPPKIDEKVWK